MPTPVTGSPKSSRRRAVECLTGILDVDPGVQQYLYPGQVRAHQGPDANQGGDNRTPIAVHNLPSLELLPVSPGGRTVDRFSGCVRLVELALEYRVMVAGKNQLDLLDLDALVLAAFHPDDDTARRAMQARLAEAGIVGEVGQRTVSGPAQQPSDHCWGTGALLVTVQI